MPQYLSRRWGSTQFLARMDSDKLDKESLFLVRIPSLMFQMFAKIVL